MLRPRELPLFGCATRVCAEQIDLSRNHVRVQSIFAVRVFLREAGEEASVIRAVLDGICVDKAGPKSPSLLI